jgi:hypothetical protein
MESILSRNLGDSYCDDLGEAILAGMATKPVYEEVPNNPDHSASTIDFATVY